MANPKLSIGKRAPAFTLKDDQGERFRLTEHRGRWIVVFYCPAHTSNSCRTEAADFNKYLAEFKKADILVDEKQNIIEANLAWRQMRQEDAEYAAWLNGWNEHRKKTLDVFKKSQMRAWKQFKQAYRAMKDGKK